MHYDETKAEWIGDDGLSARERRVLALSSPGQRYLDVWGEKWVRQGDHHIVRLSDGNIGSWQQGRGLEAITKITL